LLSLPECCKNKEIMRKIINKILDLLFPQHCFGCRKDGSLLCKECLVEFPRADNENLEKFNTYALFDYKNKTLKKALWALKYKGRTTLVRIFAQMLYDELLEELNDKALFENFSNPILLPIPLSRRRLRERGFNQAELLAKELSRIDNNQTFSLQRYALEKIRETKPQMSIKNKEERLQNVKECFGIKNSEKIQGQNIILIDDITTTGATMIEAQRVLRKAGAKKVIGFTIAH